MQITKLKVSNFRSFGMEETLIPLKEMSVLIGNNSTGKTTAMQALIKLFGVYAKERELVRADFHVPLGVDPEDLRETGLYIEAVIEFAELHNPDGTGTGCIPPLFNHMVANGQGQDPYVRIRLSATWQRGNTPDGDIDANLEFITVAEGETITSENRVPVKSHQRSLIQALYVPAMRDPRTQLKHDSGTILYRFFKAVKWSPGLNETLRVKSEEVNELFTSQPGVRTVETIIKEQWKEFHDDIKYSDAGLGFSATELDKILKRVEVYFRPTPDERSYTVEQLGDGLRSLFYISLVSALLKLEADYTNMTAESGIEIDCTSIPVLTIMALEEPENHLAPHLLGRVIGLLKNVSNQPNAQVIISSHTPAVLQRVEPENILYFRMTNPELRTSVKTIALPPSTSDAFKYIKEAVKAYPELYFAKLVILGEGDSEELILAKTLEAMNTPIDRSFISIVPLGGRHVNHFWRLLGQLKIPYLTILDLDRERGGGGWGRVKYVIKQLISIGYSKDELLNFVLPSGIAINITEEQLEAMHTWTMATYDIDVMNQWILWLRKYGVVFSAPLDIDFMMLKAFPSIYQQATEGTGPRIPDQIFDPDSLRQRIAAATAATLKDAGGDGGTYSEEERELFIWYSYLFLGRGKPVTHLLALKELDNQTLLNNLPEPILSLMNEAVTFLGRR
ncbi:putative ATP-dependent endonuclease of OLD family [Anaerospora hongkongensis]|uniref:Putative ATP-dependent endonuclease of OLD family n=1 Tax=Anaerospora hongkongensis TaxID=244830 RepID=A0A4V6NG91_9FIRM|nr:AAA family ATPase [Anaerospora hongkongensis]TCL35108.1 putative ATP-dependent endonuclease of OLD family [Anaerospora hongkongensis]